MTQLNDILNKFIFTRVLSHDTRTKLVHVLGRVGDEDAILTFEKAHFPDITIPTLARSTDKLIDPVENNIYSWALASVTTNVPNTHVKAIFPATELHIKKYEAQARFLVAETPALYQTVTLPFVKAIPASRTKWVQNILDGTSEADVVLFRDQDPLTGFVVLPDMKWNGAKESLYWVAITNRSDVLSLRSLNPDHMELLVKIRKAAHKLAKEKFDLEPHQLRLFVHYQPSYYHFHVHITAMSFMDAPGVTAGQAHLLDTIIDMLKLCPDYYQRATLPFVVGEHHPLYLASQAWTQSYKE
ncbi:HIT-like domain-containing protein [Phycomyces nitens]|nr:HIT-like domain-containing protein [Phycomyces nitens]